MRFALLVVFLFACKKDKDGPDDVAGGAANPVSAAGDARPADATAADATTGGTTGRTKAPPAPKDPPPCPGIDGALADAIRGDFRRVQRAEDGRVQVVVAPSPAMVDGTTTFVGPPAFSETARADGLIQGWLPVDQICSLAAAPGVTGIRAAILAKPKEGTP
jgi:hypothetical protein